MQNSANKLQKASNEALVVEKTHDSKKKLKKKKKAKKEDKKSAAEVSYAPLSAGGKHPVQGRREQGSTALTTSCHHFLTTELINL